MLDTTKTAKLKETRPDTVLQAVEFQRVVAETNKLLAEAAKTNAETQKIKIELRYYPTVVLSAAVAAIISASAVVILKFI